MARLTAGRVLPGGLVVPPAPKIFLGADDAWNFDAAGGCNPTSSPHAGIELDCMLARRMAIRRIHYAFGNGPPSNKWPWPGAAQNAQIALTNPRCVPFIAHGSQGGGATGFPVKTAGGGYTNTTGWLAPNGTTYHGIDIITQGKYDAAYTDAFTRIGALNSPVFFNLFMEFNLAAMGAYGAYQGGVTNTGGAGPAAFIACFRHLHALSVSAGADNMIWCWVPSFDNNSAGYNPQSTLYYPGDDVVDVIGIDLYRHEWTGNVDFLYNFAVARPNTSLGMGVGKPFIVAENGWAEIATANTPNQAKSVFVNHFRTDVQLPKYQEMIGFIPWNHQGVQTNWNNLIDTSPATLTAFQGLAADTAFDVYYVPGSGGGGTGGGDQAPLSTVPPSLNDTTPTVGQSIMVIDGQWSASPAPSIVSAIDEAPNTAAAAIQPLGAWGMSAF